MKKRIFTSVVAIAAAMSLSVAAFAAVEPGATNGSQSSDAVTVEADKETVMEGDKGLSVTAPAGSFADTVTSVKMVADVTATDNTAAEAPATAIDAVAKANNVTTEITVNTKLSITLEDQDGKAVQPNGKVTVTVVYDGVSNIIAYVDGNNVEFIALTVSADKKTASFETSHFSDYYMVKVADDQVEALVGKSGTADNAAGDPTKPDDDKNQPTGVVLAIVPAAVAAAAVVVSKKRK